MLLFRVVGGPRLAWVNLSKRAKPTVEVEGLCKTKKALGLDILFNERGNVEQRSVFDIDEILRHNILQRLVVVGIVKKCFEPTTSAARLFRVKDGTHEKIRKHCIQHKARLLFLSRLPELALAFCLGGSIDMPHALLLIRGWTPGPLDARVDPSGAIC